MTGDVAGGSRSTEVEARRTVRIGRGEVHVVWLRQEGDAADVDAARDVLTDRELQRASELRRPSERTAFVLRRAGLRRELGERLGVDPRDVALATAPSGRPVVAPPNPLRLTFSLAQRHPWAVVAIGRDVTVGVDVERDVAGLPVLDLAERAFGPGDLASVRTAADPRREFLIRWTRLEAGSKLTGQGLAATVDGSRAVPTGAVTRSLACPDGFAGTLACLEPPRRVVQMRAVQ